jgi:predicted RNase H-like HicB family nuclease
MKVPIYIRSNVEVGSVQAWSPDLPGLSAGAATVEEALELIRRRLAGYFDSSRSASLPPGTRRVEVEPRVGAE